MKNNQKFKKAFTLPETLITIFIIGIITILTVVSTINSGNIQRNRMLTTSKTFYSNVDLTYQNILSLDTNNYSIQNIKNYTNIHNISDDSRHFLELFSHYMDLEILPNCNSLEVESGLNSFKPNELQCARTNQDLVVGFYLDRNCNNNYQIVEFLSEDNNNLKTVEDACGYIIYQSKDAKGILGVDTFIITLGNSKLK